MGARKISTGSWTWITTWTTCTWPIIGYLGQFSQERLLDEQVELDHDYMSVATCIENIGDMVETNLVETGGERIANGVRISPATEAAIGALDKKVCWAVETEREAV